MNMADPNTIASAWRALSRRWSLTMTILLCVGVVLSVTAFYYIRKQEMIRLQFVLESRSLDYAEDIQRGIDRSLEIVDAVGIFCSHEKKLERQEFSRFVKGFLPRHEEIQALEWIPRVSDQERAFYEKAAQKQGLPDFRFTEQKSKGVMIRAAKRKEYFPVYYLEPLSGNESAAGFDLASNPLRLRTMESSRDSGGMLAAGRITLVQETGEQYGLLIFSPVYGIEKLHETVEDRRKNLTGFALGVFRIGDFIDKTIKGHYSSGIDITLYDYVSPANEQLLYFHQAQLMGGKPLVSDKAQKRNNTDCQWRTTLNMPGRAWSLQFTATPEFFAEHKRGTASEVLFIGLLITVAIEVYLFMKRRRQNELEAFATHSVETDKGIEMRRKSEEVLRLSSEYYRVLTDESQDSIFVINRNDDVQFINIIAAKQLGLRPEQVIGKASATLFPPDIAEHQRAKLQKIFETGAMERFEYLIPFHGSMTWQDIFLIPITNETGEVNSVMGVARDITKRKKAEDSIVELNKILGAEADKLLMVNMELKDAQDAGLNIMEDMESERRKLDASLKKSGVLLREVHHRVKNNLQIILSLMRLQARAVTDSSYDGIFKDTISRITAISLIHEKLYHSETFAKIGLRDYIRDFVGDLFQTYGVTEGRISLKTDVEAPDIDLDKAIPLGLIINELITNSIKHAFTGDRTGEIRITIQPVSLNELELIVADNGNGIPVELNIRDTKTLGMQLIISLAEQQLRGSIEISRNKGTEVRIRFKL